MRVLKHNILYYDIIYILFFTIHKIIYINSILAVIYLNKYIKWIQHQKIRTKPGNQKKILAAVRFSGLMGRLIL